MRFEQIWLTGFMGTGKSRTARPLAAALDWQAVDLDEMIEHEAGKPVAEIFHRSGEAAFRAIESQAIARVAELAHVVVAAGGGSVLAEANREAMRRRGFVVCLDATPETIAQRIVKPGGHISERPLLAGGDPLARIRELKAERQPLYEQADLVVATDDLTPDQCTHQILTAFHDRSTLAGSAT
ncbi:MAG: shikimate kinase [Chloroflexota bacterium]|nr:shikimate kinase [Chloroflexota bacterium]